MAARSVHRDVHAERATPAEEREESPEDWCTGFAFQLRLIVGAAFAFWQGSGHSLQAGVEYAPAFVESVTVHNVGVTFGWQLL